MRFWIAPALLLLVWCAPTPILAETPLGVRPLHKVLDTALAGLPPHAHLLLDQAAIEQFLVELEDRPPEWATVYGQGHHDPEHDERLFALNRERDARRKGKAPLKWLIVFVWLGELSQFDDQREGFPIALGPRFNRTAWGDVRFKHEDVPATLLALAAGETAELTNRLRQGERVEIDVLMMGHLIEEESLVYDFSHEEEGRGLIMPVVRVESVEFVLKGGLDRRE
jgi:hypothetical protein